MVKYFDDEDVDETWFAYCQECGPLTDNEPVNYYGAKLLIRKHRIVNPTHTVSIKPRES